LGAPPAANENTSNYIENHKLLLLLISTIINEWKQHLMCTTLAGQSNEVKNK